MEGRARKQVSIGMVSALAKILWPDFVVKNGCVFAGFQWGDDSTYSAWTDPKTEIECFINHTHVLDEFVNQARFKNREPVAEELDAIEEIYDESHLDFLAACEVGKTMARMWAMKLRSDFPGERFRVYYTQYDNPNVRFHKVRPNEHLWLSDKELMDATDTSFRGAVIYDTDYIDAPAVKKPL